MKKIILFFSLCFIFTSCSNDSANTSIVGRWEWTIQHMDSTPFTRTPEITGIQETLTINSNGTYSVSKNNKITNSGTYKKSKEKNYEGKYVKAILYSNTRVTDSVDYYSIDKNSNTLVFSFSLLGYDGAGSREYTRK